MMDITGREYIYGLAQDKNGVPYLFNMGELVRCKDCKYWEGGCKESGNGIMMAETEADDFCSYGERKGGDNE